jgi:uncharacterized protein (TIGR00369 family)
MSVFDDHRMNQDCRELPNSDTHRCFGCSPHNTFGLQMKFFAGGGTVFSRVTVPRHMGGWHNVVHGGIVSTILDETMGWCGIYLLKKITLTKTMTVDFIKAVQVDDPLIVEGEVVETTSEREAEMESRLFNSKAELCAKAKGIFALLTPKLAKRLGIMTEEDIVHFFEPLKKLGDE